VTRQDYFFATIVEKALDIWMGEHPNESADDKHIENVFSSLPKDERLDYYERANWALGYPLPSIKIV
jgi:hypothetical protein